MNEVFMQRQGVAAQLISLGLATHMHVLMAF